MNWTRSIAALALLCAVFSFSAAAQSDQTGPLDAEAAAALVQELSDGLPDLIEDEAAVEKITEKWGEREDLAGKTREQILKLLFADVRAIVSEKGIQSAVWANWNEEVEDKDEEAAVKKTTPTVPVKPTKQKADGEAEEGDAKEEEVARKQAQPAAPVRPTQQKKEDDDEGAGEDWSTMDATRKLNAEDVLWMQEDFEDELSDYIEDEAQLAAIVKKWKARKDLAGRTKAAIADLLFADVRSVIKDNEMLDEIRDLWKVADATTDFNFKVSKELEAKIKGLRKSLYPAAEKNMAMWKQAFGMLNMERKPGDIVVPKYDADIVAGFILGNPKATPEEAWSTALEGMIAYGKINKQPITKADVEWMTDITIKTVACQAPLNCDAVRKYLTTKAWELLVKKYGKVAFVLFLALNMTQEATEIILTHVVKTTYQVFQGMEFYDPYKIEADCLKNGGDQIGCFKATWTGILGYAIFGKQADDGIKIDQKSLELHNRWKEEGFKKFTCGGDDGKDCSKWAVKKP